MFILDVSKLNIKNNYSNLFGSKKIEQTDEEFKETWDKLKYMQRPMKRGSNDNINVENYSLKEEAMLGDEFLGMINSPTVSSFNFRNLEEKSQTFPQTILMKMLQEKTGEYQFLLL